jgi:hypothetical protein
MDSLRLINVADTEGTSHIGSTWEMKKKTDSFLFSEISNAFEIGDKSNHFKVLAIVLNSPQEKARWIQQIKLVLKEVQLREIKQTIHHSIEQKRLASSGSSSSISQMQQQTPAQGQ